MERHLRKTFEDILSAINEIESFFSTRPRRFDTYISDTCLRRAIQMNIAIIGEATNRVKKIDPNIEIPDARKIISTRNYLIHGYDSLNHEIIWAIVIKHLPNLKSQILEILNENSSKTIDNGKRED